MISLFLSPPHRLTSAPLYAERREEYLVSQHGSTQGSGLSLLVKRASLLEDNTGKPSQCGRIDVHSTKNVTLRCLEYAKGPGQKDANKLETSRVIHFSTLTQHGSSAMPSATTAPGLAESSVVCSKMDVTLNDEGTEFREGCNRYQVVKELYKSEILKRRKEISKSKKNTGGRLKPDHTNTKVHNKNKLPRRHGSRKPLFEDSSMMDDAEITIGQMKANSRKRRRTKDTVCRSTPEPGFLQLDTSCLPTDQDVTFCSITLDSYMMSISTKTSRTCIISTIDSTNSNIDIGNKEVVQKENYSHVQRHNNLRQLLGSSHVEKESSDDEHNTPDKIAKGVKDACASERNTPFFPLCKTWARNHSPLPGKDGLDVPLLLGIERTGIASISA
ncbi:hypothetical protein PR202_gb13206 [Eleusine coracana subsp. coracana]|uniref:Uncharacterized protein n=1 Tax=Eleusine coracana subsp. coracana TaxID=191504 RepID=A0AAV5ERV2_ELECO|nr:hypothetical protein PR202_gb13206 [Eleusine coracana subsp. coracana]